MCKFSNRLHDVYNFYTWSGKCRNTLYEAKSYLVVKIHVNHVDVCTLLHFWSTLHSETDMADTFDRVRFSKLFLHHCYDVKSSPIIFFNDLPFSSKLYQKFLGKYKHMFMKEISHLQGNAQSFIKASAYIFLESCFSMLYVSVHVFLSHQMSRHNEFLALYSSGLYVVDI